MNFSQTPTLAVGLVALVASAVMFWRAARRQREVPGEEKARQFRRFTRRRFVMSILVGLVGAGLVASTPVSSDWCARHPLDVTVFWLGVIVALVVLLALAVADVYAVLYAQFAAHCKSANWAPPKDQHRPGEKPRG